MASSGGGMTTPKVKKENSANGGANTTGSGRKWTMPSLPHILPKAGELLEGSGFEVLRLEEGVEVGEDLALDDRTLPLAYQVGSFTLFPPFCYSNSTCHTHISTKAKCEY